MARKLSKNELKLQDSIPIIEYYNRFAVPLANKYFKLSPGRKAGLCPFHDETDASFHFWEDTKTYHCFGCKRSGNIVKMHQDFEWVHHKRGLSKQEAMRELAFLFGIELEPEDEENLDSEGLTVFERVRRNLTDSSAVKLPDEVFSIAKFRQLNNMLRNLNVPESVKLKNYRELDVQAAVHIMMSKNS